jgi:hypothetical protein
MSHGIQASGFPGCEPRGGATGTALIEIYEVP